MNKKKLVSMFVVGALALVIGVGAVGYQTVFAQTPTPVPGNSDGTGGPGGDRGGFHGRYADEDVAAALNITVDKLRTARQTVNGKTDSLLAAELGITVDELQAAYDKAASTLHDKNPMTQEQQDMLTAWKALRSDTSFQTAMQSAYESAVKNAVTSGVITQAQADAILAQNKTGMDFPGGSFGGRPGDDGTGRPDGGKGGPGKNAAPGTPSQSSTSTSP